MLKAILTNIQAFAQISKEKKSATRESYFDRKWGEQVAFKKTIDRPVQVNDTQEQTAQIHEQILVMYKTTPKAATRAECGRGSFLNKMACESMDFIQEQKVKQARVAREEELCHNSMAALIEHIFEILKAYSYELNNALGYGPLHVAATNPQSVTEVIKFNSLRQAEETVTYHRARLSTPHFSLVVRGDKRGIHFYVIPVERAIGLSKQECQFLPVARLQASVFNGTVNWETDSGRALTPSMVELTCMNLFQRLIDETKEQVRRNGQNEPGEDISAAS